MNDQTTSTNERELKILKETKTLLENLALLEKTLLKISVQTNIKNLYMLVEQSSFLDVSFEKLFFERVKTELIKAYRLEICHVHNKLNNLISQIKQ